MKVKIFLILIFFLLPVSCSKEDKLAVDIDAFKKQGKKINLFSESQILNKDIYKITNIKINNYQLNNNQWNQSNLNSQNLILPSDFNISYKKKIISKKIYKLIFSNNFFIGIDHDSNVFIFDTNFKIVRKIKLYKKKISGFEIDFSIAIIKKNIIISDSYGNIRALDFDTLKTKWIQKLTVPFKSDIKIYRNKIYIINANSKLYSIDYSNGEIEWSLVTASKIFKSNGSYQIAISDNKLIFTNDYAEIYCLDLINLNILWTLKLQMDNFQNYPYSFKSTKIIIKNDNLFFSNNYNNTYSINIKNGSVNWINNNYFENIILAEDKIFLVKKRNFIILNKKGETIFNKNYDYIFQNEKINNHFFKNIFIGKNQIYIFTNSGYILSIDIKNLKNIKIFSKEKSFNNYILFNKDFIIITNNSLIKY